MAKGLPLPNFDQIAPRIAKRAEIIAKWYLRFNEYFPLESFIIHDAGARKQVGGQLTEADLLAVRLPHTREVIKSRNRDIVVQTDPFLDVKQDFTDFVIAEVSSRECKFNWLDLENPGQTINAEFLSYVLSRFGAWEERRLGPIVAELSEKKTYWNAEEARRIRLVSVGAAANPGLKLFQIDFAQIFDYMKNRLFNCYDLAEGDRSIKKVSDHKQWDRLLCEVYNCLRGHRRPEHSPGALVRALFPEAASPRVGEDA